MHVIISDALHAAIAIATSLSARRSVRASSSVSRSMRPKSSFERSSLSTRTFSMSRMCCAAARLTAATSRFAVTYASLPSAAVASLTRPPSAPMPSSPASSVRRSAAAARGPRLPISNSSVTPSWKFTVSDRLSGVSVPSPFWSALWPTK